ALDGQTHLTRNVDDCLGGDQPEIDYGSFAPVQEVRRCVAARAVPRGGKARADHGHGAAFTFRARDEDRRKAQLGMTEFGKKRLRTFECDRALDGHLRGRARTRGERPDPIERVSIYRVWFRVVRW